VRWTADVAARPAVVSGRKVNVTFGPLADHLHECHDASDFDTCTHDNLTATAARP
jgi:GSH-dependent disulfide-bond oxidoreductase